MSLYTGSSRSRHIPSSTLALRSPPSPSTLTDSNKLRSAASPRSRRRRRRSEGCRATDKIALTASLCSDSLSRGSHTPSSAPTAVACCVGSRSSRREIRRNHLPSADRCDSRELGTCHAVGDRAQEAEGGGVGANHIRGDAREGGVEDAEEAIEGETMGLGEGAVVRRLGEAGLVV